MEEKLRAYIAELRERATSSAWGFGWCVEQERCDALNNVADELEEMLKDERLKSLEELVAQAQKLNMGY